MRRKQNRTFVGNYNIRAVMTENSKPLFSSELNRGFPSALVEKRSDADFRSGCYLRSFATTYYSLPYFPGEVPTNFLNTLIKFA